MGWCCKKGRVFLMSCSVGGKTHTKKRKSPLLPSITCKVFPLFPFFSSFLCPCSDKEFIVNDRGVGEEVYMNGTRRKKRG